MEQKPKGSPNKQTDNEEDDEMEWLIHNAAALQPNILKDRGYTQKKLIAYVCILCCWLHNFTDQSQHQNQEDGKQMQQNIFGDQIRFLLLLF